MQQTYTIRSRKNLNKLKDMPKNHWAAYGVELVSINGSKVTVKGTQMSVQNFGACFAARDKS